MKWILLLMFAAGTAHADLAHDLLVKSDRARGGLKDGVTWEIKIQTTEDGETSDRTFMVKAKGDFAHAEAIAPARNKGEIFLTIDRNMWFFKPSLKKPVSISSRQKLTGQAANGDIASTHYSRDYDAKIEKDDKVGNEPVKVLFLKAKSPEVTYDQIRYWVSAKDGLARKAEFLNLQGQPLKVATFEYSGTIVVNKEKIPFISKMSISDAKFPQNKSVIDYGKVKPENHPDSLFNVNNLTR